MGRRRVGEYGATSGGAGQLDGPHGVVVERSRGVGDDGGRQGVGDVWAPTMAPGSLWSRTCDQVMGCPDAARTRVGRGLRPVGG